MTNSVFKFSFALLTACLPCVVASGEETEHSHTPIVHRSRPVIERLPLRVVDPVDVVVSKLGETLVADRVGKVVFRIDTRGDATLLAKNLNDLSRLAYVKSYGAHVLQSGKGSGHIIRITEAGYQSRTHLPFKPAGLGVDRKGSMLTANATTGEVWEIDAEGKHSSRARLREPARDLIVDSFGTAIVLLASGRVEAVFSNTTKTEGYLPSSTTRIAINPIDASQRVVGLSRDATGNSLLLYPGTNPGEHHRFGRAANGTSAFAFDKLGNLTLANPLLRGITRVTSHFQIPCPHCGKKVDMHFSPDAPQPESEGVASF